MSSTPDVAVIGGGVIGLSCAWRLAQDGLSVVLLERDACGAGASLASLGALMPPSPLHRRPKQSFQRESLWSWPAFAAELRDATGVDVGYERCGSLDLLHSVQRRDQAIAEARAAATDWPSPDGDPPVRILSPAEVRELEPAAVCDELGARLCRVSAQVSVAALMSALVAACRRAGVDIREGQAVTGLSFRSCRVSAVRVASERLAPRVVLVAAGAWTPSIAPELARCAPVHPTKGQAMALQVRGRPLRHIIKRRSSYLLPAADGEVLVGSTTERETGFDCRVTATGVATLAAGALQLVPALGDAGVLRTWAGLRPEPEFHVPIMGPVPDCDGLVIAAGHFKTGLSYAPIAAAMLRDWIVKGSASVTSEAFLPRPFNGN